MTYKDISELMGNDKTAFGKNDDGETVMVRAGAGFWKVETYQSNGWVRINCFYEDGTVDETYER